MAHDREVAGIRCFEVLEKLEAYLDAELSAEQVQQIEDHLRGCSWCEEFGGRYAATVTALRATLDKAEPTASADFARRLLQRAGET